MIKSSVPNVFYDEQLVGRVAIGRLIELSPAGTIKIDVLVGQQELVRQVFAEGVEVEIEQPVTKWGAPAGPPAYVLRKPALQGGA